MPKEIVMPKMGYDMTEGKLLRWIKREGEMIEAGEIIAEIETDKIEIEIEALDSGVLQRIIVQEGESAEVGAPIAILIAPGETAIAGSQPAPAALQAQSLSSGAAPAPATPAAPVQPGEQPLSRLQQTVGRRMAGSKAGIPHFYLTTHVDMTEALALRERLNTQVGEESRLSVNDLVIKAVAFALAAFPALNASFAGDRLILHDEIAICVAVAIDDGLVTPVVHHCERKTVQQIAAETKLLIEQARAGRGRAEDYEGGTFTVSNLGMFGIDAFVAIINPPQAAILAVGAIERVPTYRGDELAPCERMNITLSADHRVTDGATGARFLAAVRDELEHPVRLSV